MNQQMNEDDMIEAIFQMADARFKVGDIEIQFPPGTPPYSVQKIFAQNVVEALNNGQNALLASPTGTGKTLVLLCSTLAWQKHQKRISKPSKQIIYASRTHSQLQQVVEQLHKTLYRPNLAVLGSKQHHCVNPKIKGLETHKIVSLCQKERKAGTCEYYNVQKIQDFVMTNQLIDIEDINLQCEKNKICPYFYHRTKKDDADLLLTPYNYLLQKSLLSQSTRVNVQNSIIIFDEAHNVSSFAESGQSFQIQSCTIKKARDKLVNSISEQMVLYNYVIPTADIIFQTMSSFCKFLTNDELIKSIKAKVEKQLVYPVEQLIDIIQQNTKVGEHMRSDFNNGVNRENIKNYQKVCWELKKYFESKSISLGRNFDNWVNFIRDLELLYNDKFELNKFSYKLCLKEYKDNEIELNIWCLNPQVAFNAIKHLTHSIILTSGSLSPLDTWTTELNIPFPIQLDGNHVKNMNHSIQAYITQEFNFSFEKRNCAFQLKRLANTLVQVAQRIPKGILVVFTSYGYMNHIRESLKNSIVYQTLTQIKKLFWEPKDQEVMKQTFESYKQAVNDGAMLFCVHRGKVAEGINFSDDLCRGVILIGVPYAAWNDVRLNEKKKFIDFLQIENFNSDEWYKHQAIRTTNQALGRVIRHIKDYGIILLFDIRFQKLSLRQNLSHWVQPVLQNCHSVHQIEKSISQFFKGFETQMDQEIVNQIQQQYDEQIPQVPNLEQADQVNNNDQQVQQTNLMRLSSIEEVLQSQQDQLLLNQQQIISQSNQNQSATNHQGI